MKTYDLDLDPVTATIGCIAVVAASGLAVIGIGWLLGIGLRLAGF